MERKMFFVKPYFTSSYCNFLHFFFQVMHNFLIEKIYTFFFFENFKFKGVQTIFVHSQRVKYFLLNRISYDLDWFFVAFDLITFEFHTFTWEIWWPHVIPNMTQETRKYPISYVQITSPKKLFSISNKSCEMKWLKVFWKYYQNTWPAVRTWHDSVKFLINKALLLFASIYVYTHLGDFKLSEYVYLPYE